MDPQIRKAMQRASGKPQRVRLMQRREPASPAKTPDAGAKGDAVRELIEARATQSERE